MSEEQAATMQDEHAEDQAASGADPATDLAAPDEALDELAPNGGGTSGNHGNGTAG